MGETLKQNDDLSMDAIQPPVDPTYTLTKFEIQESGGADRAFLYSNAGTCWLAFQNTDTSMATDPASDWLNNMNPVYREQWGFTGLHSGLVTELEGLIGMMNFTAMHAECNVSLSVTGWSLGGALAQMFAVLMNAKHNPLHSDLKVNQVYSFGAYAPMVGSEATNDQAADGCFAGNQYFVAAEKREGAGVTYVADMVYNTQAGYPQHSFENSNRVFLLQDGTQVMFPCGTALPVGTDLFKLLNPSGGPDWSVYLQAHSSYPFVLGCLTYDGE